MINTVNWNEDYEKVLPLLQDTFDMIDFRIGKCRTMYYLARAASGGAIVELGTWHGNGTAALCLGTLDGEDLQVHTVDWFKDYVGITGEVYSPQDMVIFQNNIDKLGLTPVLHRGSYLEIGESWDIPISLLMWEGSLGPTDRELEVWERNVIPGGVVSLRDTLNEILGCRPMAEKLLRSGRYTSNVVNSPEVWTGGFLIVRKVSE